MRIAAGEEDEPTTGAGPVGGALDAEAPALDTRSAGDGGSPPEEAYGRVSDPGRYTVLHPAAEQLLDRLAGEYAVDRRDGDRSLDQGLVDGVEVDHVVRLTPRSGDGAALTVAFTRFPGLAVRFGDCEPRYLPRCGCDACDEDPGALLDELRRDVVAFVTGT